MDIGQMKNMVVLKNLPSNIVEEAIVILKPNQKVKNIQYIKKVEGTEKQEKNKNEYILKEAELLINNCIAELERPIKAKSKKDFQKKYKVQKYISFALGVIALIEFIII
ncbi:MAG: hypothetical protein IJ223_06000 [Clostridia bacterium]|nr:hypothetical protein [Clostridia bacterium]